MTSKGSNLVMLRGAQGGVMYSGEFSGRADVD